MTAMNDSWYFLVILPLNMDSQHGHVIRTRIAKRIPSGSHGSVQQGQTNHWEVTQMMGEKIQQKLMKTGSVKALCNTLHTPHSIHSWIVRTLHCPWNGHDNSTCSWTVGWYEEIFCASSLSHDSIKIKPSILQANFDLWTSLGLMKHQLFGTWMHVRFLFEPFLQPCWWCPPRVFVGGGKQAITGKRSESRIHSHCTGCRKDKGSASPCPEAAGWCRLMQVDAGCRSWSGQDLERKSPQEALQNSTDVWTPQLPFSSAAHLPVDSVDPYFIYKTLVWVYLLCPGMRSQIIPGAFGIQVHHRSPKDRVAEVDMATAEP